MFTIVDRLLSPNKTYCNTFLVVAAEKAIGCSRMFSSWGQYLGPKFGERRGKAGDRVEDHPCDAKTSLAQRQAWAADQSSRSTGTTRGG